MKYIVVLNEDDLMSLSKIKEAKFVVDKATDLNPIAETELSSSDKIAHIFETLTSMDKQFLYLLFPLMRGACDRPYEKLKELIYSGNKVSESYINLVSKATSNVLREMLSKAASGDKDSLDILNKALNSEKDDDTEE